MTPLQPCAAVALPRPVITENSKDPAGGQLLSSLSFLPERSAAKRLGVKQGSFSLTVKLAGFLQHQPGVLRGLERV
jgi:hypothetical protein